MSKGYFSKIFFIISCLLFASFFYLVFSGRLILDSYLVASVRYYSIFLGLSLLFGVMYVRADLKRLISTAWFDFVFYLTITSFVFARVFHVLSSASYYIDSLLHVFYIWQGGLSIIGATLGGVAYVLYFCYKNKIDKLAMLNVLVPGLVLGQIIGRFGNLFNYELLGKPSDVFFAMYVPPAHAGVFGAYFHPVFLYEMLSNAILLFVVHRRSIQVPSFAVFYFYLIWYYGVRVMLEFLKLDPPMLLGLPQNALISFALCIIGIYGFFFAKKSDSVGV